MDQTRLDAIRARCEAATKGPWELTKDGRYEDHDECRINLPNDTIELCSYENGEFIAHARTDVPALIEEVRRLQERCEAAERDRKAALFGEIGSPCNVCAKYGMAQCLLYCDFEWRGPEEDKAKEEQS